MRRKRSTTTTTTRLLPELSRASHGKPRSRGVRVGAKPAVARCSARVATSGDTMCVDAADGALTRRVDVFGGVGRHADGANSRGRTERGWVVTLHVNHTGVRQQAGSDIPTQHREERGARAQVLSRAISVDRALPARSAAAVRARRYAQRSNRNEPGTVRRCDADSCRS